MRLPSVAGFFYPNEPLEIRGLLSSFERRVPRKIIDGKIIGAVVPHAGYVYSGLTAMHAYLALMGNNRDKIHRFIIIGPSHQGFPSFPAVYDSGSWATPLGVAEIDMELARSFLAISEI
ncbi:MAG: AmmeMemoRadiSam system protein B, partial [Thermoplasmataceae archaeon]